MSPLDAAHRLFGRRPAPASDADATRRGFFRRLGGASLAALAGGGLLASREAQAATDEGLADAAAWAEVERRARLHGLTIAPGTAYDAQGRPTEAMGNEPYIAEIWLFAGNFAPIGTRFCDGSVISIAQNTALFALLGTTYGGNGQTNFALPDLRGRAPIQQGQGPGLSPYLLGEVIGNESWLMLQTEMPPHVHSLSVPVSSAAGTTVDPRGAYLAASAAGTPAYTTTAPAGATGAFPTSLTGGATRVPTLQPYLALNYVIAMEGIFPPRS